MTKKLYVAFSLLCFPLMNAIAANDYWQCTSRDATEHEWKATGDYEINALNKSYEACKRDSKSPVSCKTSKEECDFLVNGETTRPLWRCTAYDQMAKKWPSNLYRHRDDAAIAARAYCEDRSGFPDTCYINLMTCKNVNPKS